jgi:hypothetical protein
MKNHVPTMSMRAGFVKDEIKRMSDLYVGRIEVQLLQWGRALDDLGMLPGAGSSAARAIRSSSVADLRARYGIARTNLATWRALGDVKWGTYGLCVERAWSELEGAFVALRTGFAAKGAVAADLQAADGVDR